MRDTILQFAPTISNVDSLLQTKIASKIEFLFSSPFPQKHSQLPNKRVAKCIAFSNKRVAKCIAFSNKRVAKCNTTEVTTQMQTISNPDSERQLFIFCRGEYRNVKNLRE